MIALLRRPDLVPSLFSEGLEAEPVRPRTPLSSAKLMGRLTAWPAQRMVLGAIAAILAMPLIKDGLEIVGSVLQP